METTAWCASTHGAGKWPWCATSAIASCAIPPNRPVEPKLQLSGGAGLRPPLLRGSKFRYGSPPPRPPVGRALWGAPEPKQGGLRPIALRAAKVTVKLTDPSQGQRKWPASLWVVQLEEQGTNPEKEDPIRWTLWTNYDIDSLDDAMLVVSNYTARWRVKEFHRVWKSGALRIEESQLRSADSFERLARIAASVAVRILRLTYLARTQPDLAAHHEFSELEYRALQLLDPAPSSTHTIALAQAFRLLADIGGYTGKSSGGPPGALVLTRGYRELQNSVRVVERLAEKRDQW